MTLFAWTWDQNKFISNPHYHAVSLLQNSFRFIDYQNSSIIKCQMTNMFWKISFKWEKQLLKFKWKIQNNILVSQTKFSFYLNVYVQWHDDVIGFIITLLHLALQDEQSSWKLYLASFIRDSKLLLTGNTIFVNGCGRIWPLTLFPSATWSGKLWTSFLASVLTLMTFAKHHWLQWLSSFSNTIFPILKFQTLFSSYIEVGRSGEILFSICSRICNMLHTIPSSFSEYRFGLLNSTGGGMPTFVFIVRRFLGGSGISFTIMSGLELMIDLTSVISVTIPQVTVFLTILLKGILQSKFGIPILLPYKGLLMGWCVTKSILQASLVERFSSSGVSSLSMLFSIHCWHQQNLNHCLTILNRLNLSLTWIYSRLGWRNWHQVNWCQCALHGSRNRWKGQHKVWFLIYFL